MRSFSKLGLTLLAVFAISLLCLAVTLLSLLRRRRRQHQQPLAGDAEIGSKGASFNFLCCTIQSRVEPAGDSSEVCASGSRQGKIQAAVSAAVEDVDEECALAMGRQMAFGPSRALYTIKEEEREGLEEKEEEDLFATPCESPEFYTPASSPLRAPAGGEGVLYLSVTG